MTQHYHRHHGYSGNNYDRWIASQSNTTALGKVQKQFWFTKSAVLRKFGRNEDKYISASDAELDAKIELFKAIESSTKELQVLLADYQNKICMLAQEENAMGRFLKDHGKQDQTRAGKMMNAVGKSLSYTAQQRVALRSPLVRLFQEVDTFQTRAIEDTAFTVQEVEKVRTEYRGALMWMKNISKDFNPDQYEQLEKFREVQNVVKQKKSRFDQIKIKVLQKIELLAASRCNMFSHALILYQNNLITFSDKTAKTLNSIAANFKGYEPYKFQVIKELAELSIPDDAEENTEDSASFDNEITKFFDTDYSDNPKSDQVTKNKNQDSAKELMWMHEDDNDLENLFSYQNTEDDQLLNFEEKRLCNEQISNPNNSAKEEFTDVNLLLDDQASLNFNEKNFEAFCNFGHFQANFQEASTIPHNPTAAGPSNTSEVENLKELHHTTPLPPPFLPSQLLDFGFSELQSLSHVTKPCNSNDSSMAVNDHSDTSKQPEQQRSSVSPHPGPKTKENPTFSKETSSDITKKSNEKLDWFKVFQEIDPLSDPASALFTKGLENKKC